uniref:Clathrin assembly protein n=1 Tax=Caenorhabditis tropicalis TaxID=1561998 RepID=A0A1I7TTS1_9PELO
MDFPTSTKLTERTLDIAMDGESHFNSKSFGRTTRIGMDTNAEASALLQPQPMPAPMIQQPMMTINPMYQQVPMMTPYP